MARLRLVPLLFLLLLHLLFTLLTLVRTSAADDSASCNAADADVDGIDATKHTQSESIFNKLLPNDAASAMKFLKEEVFCQKNLSNDHPQQQFLSVLEEVDEQDGDGKKGSGNPFFLMLEGLSKFKLPGMEESADTTTPTTAADNAPNEIVSQILQRAAVLGQQEKAVDGMDYFNRISDALNKAVEQINSNFNDVLQGVDTSTPLAAVYFAARMDSLQNPTWKRRIHRFYDKVSKKQLIQLHDALYLSALSYLDTVEAFQQGLKTFQDGVFEMLSGTTKSLPDLPASFLLIHKQLTPLDEPSLKTFFQGKTETEVLVVLVVRGTKHLPDMLADSLLAPAEYRGGFVHEGLLNAGKNLAAKHLPMLKELHQQTGRDKLKLILVGHSLGAGAAAIAAMELKDHDFLKVEAVGFGCPSLLSRELAESTKKYITTVVTDSDIVPRMSGASMANMILDLLEYDWTEDVLEDIEFSLERARDVFGFGSLLPNKDSALGWVTKYLDMEVRPKLKQLEKKERLPSLLIPPGVCLHLFRDGYGFTGTFTPCDFFSNVEVSRNMIDDHMIGTGYDRAMLSAAQDSDRDYMFRFANDIPALAL